MLFALSTAAAAVVVPSGGRVVVVGNGGIQVLAARLAAIRGYETTLACIPQFIPQTKLYAYCDTYPEGSIPLTILPIAGEQKEMNDIEDAAAAAEALILAFDSDKQTLPDSALNVFLPPSGSKIKRVAMMSRYLNGKGMGPIAKAAKFAANGEIWAADGPLVAQYKAMEASVKARAKEVGASSTIIRAGTLKAGASGDSLSGGGGEPMFLNPEYYKAGQQDVVNWRLLYDCSVLGVELSKGDTLPGPGFTAALTATTPEGGTGDSHRGAVAMALVESLRADAAADADFSVASVTAREFPSEEEWAKMFARAA